MLLIRWNTYYNLESRISFSKKFTLSVSFFGLSFAVENIIKLRFNNLLKDSIEHEQMVISFVLPDVFIIKLDWSVCICLTQLYDGRDMYTIYYIKNNYMFRHFTLVIFRLRNGKKLSKQLYSTYVGCIQWGGKR